VWMTWRVRVDRFHVAAKLYQTAAEQDVPWAQANLGRLYESGKGVPKR